MAKTLVIIGSEQRLADVAASAARSTGAIVSLDGASTSPADVVFVGTWVSTDATGAALVNALRRHPNAVVVLSSDPSVAEGHWLRDQLGLPRERLIAPGTVVASRRFREAIAARLRLHPHDVQAMIVGVPGVRLLPLWSSASVAGIPLSRWAVMGHGRLEVRERAALFLGASADDVTDEQPGQVLQEIVESILTDSHRIFPVATWVTGYHGLDDCWLSLPCIINAGGAEPPLEVPMNDAELAGLRQAVELARATPQPEDL